jgi:GH25 family lysozyme M1 (1,4-beta-N-acetylmuramidase)
MSAKKPLIVDVSSNQVHPIDWVKVKRAGVSAAILKATQGTDYVNPFFEEDLKGCNAAKIPVMAYHFAMFGNSVKEAQAFMKVAGARSRVLDVETSTNLAWANEFLRTIQRKFTFAEDQTMLYGSAESIPRRGVLALRWVADYGVATPGVPCACWQYTGTGKIAGIENDVDLSYWMGTAAQFDKFFGIKR